VASKRREGHSQTLKAPRPRLTARESVVLELVAAGGSNREIAAELSVSQQSIAYHVGRLLARFGTRSRTGLVSKAFVVGYLDPRVWPPRVVSD
jgi:DNA-binding NarL/FixJ family response regulator